jgi:outer membrane protein assembly factor BamB
MDTRPGATHSVLSLNTLTGHTIWSTTIPGSVTHSADPVIANGVIYVGSKGIPKAVQAVRLDNGVPLAALQVGTGAGNNVTNPVVIDGIVLAAVIPAIKASGRPPCPPCRRSDCPDRVSRRGTGK